MRRLTGVLVCGAHPTRAIDFLDKQVFREYSIDDDHIR